MGQAPTGVSPRLSYSPASATVLTIVHDKVGDTASATGGQADDTAVSPQAAGKRTLIDASASLEPEVGSPVPRKENTLAAAHGVTARPLARIEHAPLIRGPQWVS
jgi:hypothetical protein